MSQKSIKKELSFSRPILKRLEALAMENGYVTAAVKFIVDSF